MGTSGSPLSRVDFWAPLSVGKLSGFEEACHSPTVSTYPRRRKNAPTFFAAIPASYYTTW